ncbi:MAG: serine/threonine protein kinase, partial [Proteobacteria bacterium]|nr:serine/threonine protein kinase [Pseudomonadota bacterium]
MAQERLAFTFRECLGAGGFGEVYLASQHTAGGIKRLVAVKVLSGEFDDDSDAVRRLRDEGQILAMLAHPAILGVHQFTRVNNRLALVTEYVEGFDLGSFCAPDTLMPPRAAVGIVGVVADALDFAWRTHHPETGRPLHLIHRDIKPENIRLSLTGQVKLLDFGIARTTEMTRQAKTAMGDVLMTPGYGAPEALAFGVTGPKVDVYALGATLFRMLQGERFYGKRPIEFHLALALDTQDYAEFLAERLARVRHGATRDLLSSMMAHAPEHRPSAGSVCEQSETIVNRMGGPTYAQWTREYHAPAHEPSNVSSPLEGMSLTSAGEVVNSGSLGA